MHRTGRVKVWIFVKEWSYIIKKYLKYKWGLRENVYVYFTFVWVETLSQKATDAFDFVMLNVMCWVNCHFLYSVHVLRHTVLNLCMFVYI